MKTGFAVRVRVSASAVRRAFSLEEGTTGLAGLQAEF